MSRLLAAQRGLVDILAMPPVHGIGTDEPIMDAVVSASETVRRLIEWHAVRTQHDQGFTVVVSVREACESAEWQDFLAGRMIDLHLDDAFFAPWIFPRLRGVSAEYVGQGTRSFRMQLVPPLHGRRSDGVRIDQAKVPPCYLGRVAPRQERREPEQNGAVTLMNVCPVGDDGASWRVQIDRFEGAPFPGAEMVDDVELRFACVGIPRQFDGIF